MTLAATRSDLLRAARRLTLAMMVAVALTLQGPTTRPVLAAAGDLDPSFDGDGKVTTAWGTSSTPMYGQAAGVGIQQNGRIVALGIAGTSEMMKDFALVGYTPAGQLDPTFGAAGKVITPIGTGEDVGRAMAIQADDKIVAAGIVTTLSSTDFAVARYLPNGAPDLTFSGDGKVITSVSSTIQDGAHAVSIQQDGKIVAAGFVSIGSYEQFALVRYLTDGQLDPSFGSGGIVSTSFGAGEAIGYTMAIQQNGRIVVGGRFKNDIALARYLDNGQLDPTFGNGGKVVTILPGSSRATSISLQADGMIVVGGSAHQNGAQAFVVARYRGYGVLDPNFGSGGIVMTQIVPGQTASLLAVAMHTKGTIVAGGNTCPMPYHCHFALVRYLPTGQLDPHFGTGGTVTTKFFGNLTNIHAIAIGKGDRIVAAGMAKVSNDEDSLFALARYLAE
jgi:uncharacterized delta-60 repeat protein